MGGESAAACFKYNHENKKPTTKARHALGREEAANSASFCASSYIADSGRGVAAALQASVAPALAAARAAAEAACFASAKKPVGGRTRGGATLLPEGADSRRFGAPSQVAINDNNGEAGAFSHPATCTVGNSLRVSDKPLVVGSLSRGHVDQPLAAAAKPGMFAQGASPATILVPAVLGSRHSSDKARSNAHEKSVMSSSSIKFSKGRSSVSKSATWGARECLSGINYGAPVLAQTLSAPPERTFGLPTVRTDVPPRRASVAAPVDFGNADQRVSAVLQPPPYGGAISVADICTQRVPKEVADIFRCAAARAARAGRGCSIDGKCGVVEVLSAGLATALKAAESRDNCSGSMSVEDALAFRA